MKKIIITGALGQDGFILSKILLKNKYKVFGIVKNNKKKSLKKVIYIKLDLSNFDLIKKKFDKIKPDVIVHFGSKNPSIHENIKKSLFLRERCFYFFFRLWNASNAEALAFSCITIGLG